MILSVLEPSIMFYILCDGVTMKCDVMLNPNEVQKLKSKLN